MKKYCPFCDSELSETLWCEQCKRYSILYNTHDAADTSAPVPASKPVPSAVPEDSGKNPGKDTPKIILIGSMLAACLILCLVVCAHLVLKRGAEPSDAARATQSDTRASESVREPAEPISTETPTQSAAEILTSDETSAQPAEEASPEPDAAEIGWKQLEQRGFSACLDRICPFCRGSAGKHSVR